MADTSKHKKLEAKLAQFGRDDAKVLNDDLSSGWQIRGFTTHDGITHDVLLVREVPPAKTDDIPLEMLAGTLG